MENSVSMQMWLVDEDYLNTIGMEMVKGRFFSREFPSDSTGMVLNERAARLFGFENPISEEIQTFEDQPDNSIDENKLETYHVIGVVKDFHFESLRENIGALCMLLRPSTGKVSFRFNATQASDVIDLIKNKWNETVVGEPFQYTFLDQDFGNMYAAEKKIGQIFTSFAGLAVIIASLGLFGLASYTTEQKKREIGIRKVLGASLSSIIGRLALDFTKWVVLANIVAWPIAYFITHQLLQNYAYRVSLGIDIFIGSCLVSLFISALTVAYQSTKAAYTNPIETIRRE